MQEVLQNCFLLEEALTLLLMKVQEVDLGKVVAPWGPHLPHHSCSHSHTLLAAAAQPGQELLSGQTLILAPG